MNARARFLQLLVIACVIAATQARLAGQVSKDIPASGQRAHAELDSFLRKAIVSQHYVGLGAALLKNGEIVWEGYYGWANREEGTHLGRENIFQLASLSKVVTALALMKLYESGRLGLDDDVNTHMAIRLRHPNFPNVPITFRMLLNHTAGFVDVTPTGLKVPKDVGRPPSAIGDSPMPLEEYIKELLAPEGKYYSTEYFGENEPGTQYSYSNIGYALLGYLIEKISGVGFDEYCNANIFDPLEMNDTGWHLRDLDTARVVFGYSFSPNDSVPNYRKVRHFGEPGYPSGMLRTCMHDFARFLAVLLNQGRFGDVVLLKPETIDLMLRPQGMKNISSRSFRIIDRSLGWNIIDLEGSELYAMNGFSGSIYVDAYFSLKDRIGTVYYFTGINMKNMAAVPEIARRLHRAAKELD